MDKKKPRVGSAVLVEKDGKFLLGLRNKQHYFGHWIIPGGGVNFGETIEEAGVREIKEETNLDVELVKPIGHREIIDLPDANHRIVFYHLATPKHTDIIAREDISEARFFTMDEIKQLPKLAESARWVFKQIGVWDSKENL